MPDEGKEYLHPSSREGGRKVPAIFIFRVYCLYSSVVSSVKTKKEFYNRVTGMWSTVGQRSEVRGPSFGGSIYIYIYCIYIYIYIYINKVNMLNFNFIQSWECDANGLILRYLHI